MIIKATINNLLAQVSLPKTPADSAHLTTVLNIVLAILGAICVLMITIAGLQFVLSGGDPQKAAKARMTILYAVAGVVVAIVAAAIVNLVVTKIT